MRRILLWIDAVANYERIGSRAEIKRIASKAKSSGVTTLVLDIKPIEGSVLYRSRIAPFFKKKDIEMDSSHDPLAVLIAEAHSLGLEVFASLNVFCEGKNGFGLAYTKKDWASQAYTQALYLEKDGNLMAIARYNTYPKAKELSYLTADSYDSLSVAGAAAIIKDNKVAEIVTKGEVSLHDNPVVYGLDSMAEILKQHLGSRLVVKNEIRPVSAWADIPHGFVNPLLPQVQAYELALLEEVISHYQIDGIVLNKVRYHSINCDFSPKTRKLFEDYLGKEVENWPEDILTLKFTDGKKQFELGPLAKEWFYFRSLGIKDFIIKARERVKSLRPDLVFGDYSDSWYPDYYALGANWASNKYQFDSPLAKDGYKDTGYAEVLDFLISGNYYEDVYLKDLENKVKAKVAIRTEAGQSPEYKPWHCVEGAAELVNQVILKATTVYGGLYLLKYHQKPEVIKEAIQVCLNKSAGVMLFDLVYIDHYDWWDLIKETIRGGS